MKTKDINWVGKKNFSKSNANKLELNKKKSAKRD